MRRSSFAPTDTRTLWWGLRKCGELFSEPEFRESSGEMSRGQRVREQATEKLLQLLYILGECKKEQKTDRRGFLDVIGEKEGANKKDSESRLGLVSRMVSSRRYLGLDVAFKLGIPKQMNPSLARSDTLQFGNTDGVEVCLIMN